MRNKFQIIYFFPLMFFCFQTFTSYSQTKKQDSLIGVISKFKRNNHLFKKDTIYIKTLLKLAYTYNSSSTDSLKTLSKKALKYSLDTNYQEGISVSYYNIGKYYLRKGKDSLVFSYLQKAKDLALKRKDTLLLLKISNSFSIEFNHKGESTKSLQEYLEAMKIASKYPNKKRLRMIYCNIAATYEQKKMHNKAFVYFKKGLELALEINDHFSIATTSCNLAEVYLELNNIEKAKKHINESIHLLEQLQNKSWLGYAYMNKGDIFLKEKKYDEALSWFYKSEPIQLGTNYNVGVLELYNSMSRTYIHKNNFTLGKEYAFKAYNLSKKIKHPRGIAASAENISLVYEKLKIPTKSLEYHKLFKKMDDSISKEKQIVAMAFLDIEQEHKREQEKLIHSNNERLRKQKSLLSIAVISLILLSFIAFLIVKNLKTQKTMSADLKNTNETKDKLFSIIGHDLKSPIISLKELLNLNIEDPAIFKRFAPQLRKEVNHIQFTLENLLSWGKTQMKGTVVYSKRTNLNEICQDNINLFSNSLKNKEIDLHALINSEIYVYSDKDHTDLILRNLISNAIKFTPLKGKIIIKAIHTKETATCSITNSGSGIKKENLNKVLNKTYHYSTYGTQDEKGTGLGLSLCKEMIELNHGKIWVSSEEEISTTFTFSLPIYSNKKHSS